jgi:hypothetical protein
MGPAASTLLRPSYLIEKLLDDRVCHIAAESFEAERPQVAKA